MVNGQWANTSNRVIKSAGKNKKRPLYFKIFNSFICTLLPLTYNIRIWIFSLWVTHIEFFSKHNVLFMLLFVHYFFFQYQFTLYITFMSLKMWWGHQIFLIYSNDNYYNKIVNIFDWRRFIIVYLYKFEYYLSQPFDMSLTHFRDIKFLNSLNILNNCTCGRW